jgi:hypothetical protein
MNIQTMERKGYCVAIANALQTLLEINKRIFSTPSTTPILLVIKTFFEFLIK